MSGVSSIGRVTRLRRRLLLGVGLTLFGVGIVVLGVGLAGYLDESDTGAESQAVADIPTVPSIDDVENLPVAIPYYNPQQEAEEAVREVTSPLRIAIESIGIDAPVIELGLEDNGIPQVPLNGQDVAWYDFSSKPGGGSNAVFAAHINWAGELGVFGELSKVQPGDTVRLISQDGREYVYEVTGNFAVDPEDPESLKVMAPTDDDMVTLITCGGTWLPNPSEQFGGNYTERTIVQGKLMESSVSAAPVAAEIIEG